MGFFHPARTPCPYSLRQPIPSSVEFTCRIIQRWKRQHRCQAPPEYPHKDPIVGSDLFRDSAEHAKQSKVLERCSQTRRSSARAVGRSQAWAKLHALWAGIRICPARYLVESRLGCSGEIRSGIGENRVSRRSLAVVRGNAGSASSKNGAKVELMLA